MGKKEGNRDSNWKKDLNDVVEETMSIDDFIEKWSGRSPEEMSPVREETKIVQEEKKHEPEQKKPWHADEDAKAKVLRLLAEARKKIGV